MTSSVPPTSEVPPRAAARRAPAHRKPRRPSPALARTGFGVTTAALTSVVLLAPQAGADPGAARPSVEDVQRKVDSLYREAGTATQKYNAAKERTDEQRAQANGLIDALASSTEDLNHSREDLARYAAAQYRDASGGFAGTATMLLADDPQSFFDQKYVLDRLAADQHTKVREFRDQQAATARKRTEAQESLNQLTAAQQDLRTSKTEVQGKLAQARELLTRLTAEEKARLAELERRKEAEAKKKAEEAAARQKKKAEAEQAAAAEAAKKESATADSATGTGAGAGAGTSAGTGTASGSYTAKAEKAIAFARAQMGKPYVWGATGPGSYDCSGLTQAAWKAAGIDLPRTTWDQVEAGTRVSIDDAVPGDLVFFYDDISHVGLYIGNGEMIHAPKPGASVRVESIYYMPLYGVVRPA
ncbi:MULTISPECIES: C40 family peptidase [unclassified Streptomyces]|uniref:NlpC/P60 family protein n=1 Tax=Streptomyces evansiae TaxID=3075535 RepID=A0ABU2QYN3_9ACTN|nr:MULTISPECIES: C40 family peptidase [unclassified Streptomyces]MDT0409480.1 NlpC/P60 family protein [Streptomyces sp. DSM 41979]MYQ58206.1 glycoside hydrolase [Streptomyces sp. SID4926]SCD40449.1 Cell wall-associated hydrolase, NlpC family [Streptomyces sp. DfronAA-171]